MQNLICTNGSSLMIGAQAKLFFNPKPNANIGECLKSKRIKFYHGILLNKYGTIHIY